MIFTTLYNLIELTRKELYDIAEEKDFNFQDPLVLEKSRYLDKLINTYSKSVVYVYFSIGIAV